MPCFTMVWEDKFSLISFWALALLFKYKNAKINTKTNPRKEIANKYLLINPAPKPPIKNTTDIINRIRLIWLFLIGVALVFLICSYSSLSLSILLKDHLY